MLSWPPMPDLSLVASGSSGSLLREPAWNTPFTSLTACPGVLSRAALCLDDAPHEMLVSEHRGAGLPAK